jgi:hypothetical protein
MAIMMTTMTAKKYAITAIPANRRWEFPSLEFNDCRFSVPTVWISDPYRTPPGKIADPWNAFARDDGTHDDEIVNRIHARHDMNVMMTVLRKH